MNMRGASNRIDARGRWSQRSFTLTELLVTMAIIAIIAAITVVGVRTVAEGTKLASARNTVEAALETARGYALKNNTIVMVAFRAKLINDRTQVVEAVTAEYTGRSYFNNGLYSGAIIDMFTPIEEIPARELPEGMAVAGPHYKTNIDTLWLATSDLRATRTGEMGGAIIAVMYGPDGNTMRDNPRSDAVESFIDFNGDGLQRRAIMSPPDRQPTDPLLNDNPCDFGTVQGFGGDLFAFYCQTDPSDEPYVTTVPHLAVFNDEEARELYDTTAWSDGPTRIADQSDYINRYADRIHFNRYSGVVMK